MRTLIGQGLLLSGVEVGAGVKASMVNLDYDVR